MTRNVEMLVAAARAFGELRDEVVFRAAGQPMAELVIARIRAMAGR